MAAFVLHGDHAKDAAANEYPVAHDGPTIDLNPEDWRELADGELAELRDKMIEYRLEHPNGEPT